MVCIGVGSKILYVARAQKKVERELILRHQFEEKRKEQILKFKVVLCPFLSLFVPAFACLFILSVPTPSFSLYLIVKLHMHPIGLEPQHHPPPAIQARGHLFSLSLYVFVSFVGLKCLREEH